MDEQNTKRKIIEPLIELLGWDILSTDVELEYSVQMGSGTKKVDYALNLEDTPVVFVEAKGCDTELDRSHEDQLKSYMRQIGIDWGLLSNGREFEILRRDFSSNRPNEISLAKFPIEKVPDNEQPLKALSSKSIKSGESKQIAEKIESVQRAVRTLRTNKEGLAEDVTRVVTDIIGESVSQPVEDEAKGFVDDLIATLEEQAHRTAVTEETTKESTHASEGQYVIRLTQNGEEIHRVVGNQQAATMASLVDYLIDHEGLTDAIEIPYVPGTGQGSRALLNDKPEHTNGSKMRRYEPLSEGYYLFTALSAKDKMRYLPELPEKVGLECEFSGEW
ncbi:type I restriction enzyme HsdR N-terminal domain-containing protein [Salinirubellus sp. GCM10025818]|uniref:type I restriction enzyme HsdR N-terminal domain-containing protein n=1 Tax=Salinirubellus TaxID=2162630 RepID=UPI0030D5FA61